MPAVCPNRPLALRERAKHNHAVCKARDNGRGRIGDGRAAAPATAAPLHGRGTQPSCAECCCKPGRLAAVIAVGGETVDLPRIDPRVAAGRQNGLQGQLEFRIRRGAIPVIVRFADPDDGDTAPERALGLRTRAHTLLSCRGDPAASVPNAPASASRARRASS